MQRNLTFDQMPPLSVPLRFLFTAPLFTIVAALLLLWYGPQALESRWAPATLALTHLLTLGFLTSAMIGALLQILPVVAGVAFAGGRLSANVVHALLTIGTILLAAAFHYTEPLLFKLALASLLPGLTWFVCACVLGFSRAPAANAHTSALIRAIHLSTAALAATMVLGAVLGSAFSWSLALPLIVLTNLHAQWGLLGWVGLLLIGVAYQVMPMFQATSLYPPQITRRLAPTLFLLLALWSGAASLAPSHWLTWLLSVATGVGYAVFAIATLHLLWRRKRPNADATTLFLRLSMLSLLAGTALWLMPHNAAQPSQALTLGVLLIIGVAYSAINGMLYKIVPFLLWYHAQHASGLDNKKPPSIKQFLPDSRATKQFWMHLIALLLLLAAARWPDAWSRPAALALFFSAANLQINLLLAFRIFWRTTRAPNTTLSPRAGELT